MKKDVNNEFNRDEGKLDKTSFFRVNDNEVALNETEDTLVEKVIKDAENKEVHQKSKKTRIFNLIFFVANILVIVGIFVYQANTLGLGKMTTSSLSDINYIFFLYIALIFIAIMFNETVIVSILMKKSTKTFRPVLSYKSAATLLYYNCFVFTGQPFQILYLHKRGVKAGVATGIAFMNTFISQVTFFVVAAVILTTQSHIFGADSKFVLIIGVISLVALAVVLLIMFLFSVNLKLSSKMLLVFLKFLNKIKIIKDYKKSFTKIMCGVLEYQKSIKYYSKSSYVLISGFIFSLLNLFLRALIPLMIYFMLETVNSALFFEIFFKFVLCELVVYFIPFPGGTGVAELSFSALFSSLFHDGSIFWAMLIWRFFAYFIYLVQGLIILLYDAIYGNRKIPKTIFEVKKSDD